MGNVIEIKVLKLDYGSWGKVLLTKRKFFASPNIFSVSDINDIPYNDSGRHNLRYNDLDYSKHPYIVEERQLSQQAKADRTIEPDVAEIHRRNKAELKKIVSDMYPGIVLPDTNIQQNTLIFFPSIEITSVDYVKEVLIFLNHEKATEALNTILAGIN